MAGAVMFGVVMNRTGEVKPALVLGILGVVGALVWSLWAKRRGRFRNRNPWDP